MNNMGIDASRELPRVQTFLEQLEAAGDGILRDTVPAFQTFLGLTGDVDIALANVELATRIAESGLKDMTGAVDVIASLLSGKANRTLKDLGINMQEAADGSVNAKEAYEKLVAAFPAGLKDIDDTSDRLDKLSGAWEGFKRFVGETLVFAAEGVAQTAAAAKQAGADIGHFLGVAPYRDTSENARVAGEDAGEQFEEGFKASADIAGSATSPEEARKREEARLKAIKDREEFEARNATLDAQHEERERAKQDRARETREREEAEHREFLEKRSQLEIEAYQREQAAAEADAAMKQRLLMQEIEMLEEDQLPRRQELMEQYLLGEMAREQAIAHQKGQSVLAVTRFYLNEILKSRQQNTAALGELTKKATEEEIAGRVAVAQAAVDLGTTLFGENKALAIGQAIIDTFVAANRAMAQLPYPFNIAVAALVTAQGLARVAQIRAAEPERKKGGTFDNPVNDRIAALGGDKSAADFVRLTSSGFHRGLSQAILGAPSGPGEPMMAEPSYVVNIKGNVYGGDAGMRQLRRELEHAERLDRPGRQR